MKKRILYYSPMPADSTAFYRTSGVLPYINHSEVQLVDISHIKDFTWSVFTGANAFIFQRPFATEHVSLLTLVKDMGVRVIVDYDDDLLNVDQNNPTYHQYLYNKSNTIKCLNMADEVWVSTESIADTFSIHNSNVHVIPNSHNDYLFPVSEKRTFNPLGKKVMYRGGASHQADVNVVANEIISVVNNNQDWTFSFMGDRFHYLEMKCGDNYHIIPGMTIMQYFRYLHHENPNIGIFPLCDTVFNRGKSNISWMEMTYAGAVFFGNTDLPEFKKAGIIDFKELENYTAKDTANQLNNDFSWQLICDTLLLSNINKLRIERLLHGI